MLKLDFSPILNTVDRQHLGFPQDAVAVVQGIYEGASTVISTPLGDSRPIPIRRGNIQGDMLSPFLFTLFIEPLMHWLHVNERGYRCGTAPHHVDVVSASAYADDLLIDAGSIADLDRQAAKVHAFAAWTGMAISSPKSVATSILHGGSHMAPHRCTVPAHRPP